MTNLTEIVKDITNTTVGKLSSVADFAGFTFASDSQQVSVKGFHPSSKVGGGIFIESFGRHDGGKRISLTRAFPTDWTNATQVDAWFADSGSDEVIAERLDQSNITVEMYGALPTLDLSKIIVQASKNNSVVSLDGGTAYKLDALAVIPAYTIVDLQGAQVNVNSTNYGFVMGDNADVLNYRIQLLNLNLVLTNKTVNALWSRGNVKCEATGYIEGKFFETEEDATRTNIGLFVDGANISSFGNRWNIQFNHMHENVRVGTSGTTHPTAQVFDNCFMFGDQVTDPNSIGYNFADNGSVTQIGQGTVIRGGNVEQVNTGWYIGANTGSITVIGTRVEINITATSWKIDFANGCDPCSFTEIQGLGIDFIDTNSGVRNIASNTHTVSGLDFNDTRIGGYAGQHPAQPMMGFGGPSFAEFFDANSIIYRLQNSGSTGTGEMTTQAGNGSAASGGGISLFGGSHATYAGEVHIAPTPSALFKVKQGLYGTDRMVVSSSYISAGVDNTSSCGTEDIRFTEVRAVNGTIQTSDEHEKSEILAINEKLKLIGREIRDNIGMFQWLDSIAKKGADNARWHFGVGAQTVRDIFEEHGLDGFRYGCLCYDEWEELPEILGEVASRDSDGNIKLNEDGTTIMETVVLQEYRPAGNRYGVRPDQISYLILASI